MGHCARDCHRDWISTTNALFISGQTVKRNHQEAVSEVQLSVVSHVSPVFPVRILQRAASKTRLSAQLALTININICSTSQEHNQPPARLPSQLVILFQNYYFMTAVRALKTEN